MSSHGQFIWYDLITPDKKAAIDFYHDVVGWETQPAQGVDYTMWSNKGAPLGGVVGFGTGMGDQPAWLPYISVDDVDETAEKAKRHGGKVVHGPKDIGEGGRYATLADPQGGTFAIYHSPHSGNAPPFAPTVGQFSWHELATSNYKAAYDFYKALFGWDQVSSFEMGDMGTYFMYGKGSTAYGGMYDKPADMPMPTAWLNYIMVGDVQKAVDITKQKGGQLINGPMEVPGGDIVANCIDPQGAMFALHSRSGNVAS